MACWRARAARVIDRGKDLDVRIDIGDRASVAAPQEIEQRWFDGRSELRDVINERHLLPGCLVERQLRWSDHHERFALVVDGFVDIVQDQKLKDCPRVMPSPARCQHPGLG